MKVIKGNKLFELNKGEFGQLIKSFNSVEVDIGTGDGRFAYKSALKNPDALYIGIDPSQKQLEEYSKKAVKKRLNNVVFVLGSMELFPSELYLCADKVHINFPWGTLLGHIAKPTYTIISKIGNILKPNGTLQIILGYTQQTEPTETERLQLDDLNETYIKEKIAPLFEECNLHLIRLKLLEKSDLKDIETTWSKKLSFGSDRPIYFLSLRKLS